MKTLRSLLSIQKATLLHLLTILSLMIGAGPAALAQADFEKGFQNYQSYHGADFDTINLANGNLVLNIPLITYEQRGNLPPVVIAIRSNSTTFQSAPPYSSGPADTNQHEVPSGVVGAPWGQPHVMISPGGLTWKEEMVTIEKEQLSRFVAIDDSGATHSLGQNIANSAAASDGNIHYSVDGSDLMLTAASQPQIIDPKGNTGGLVDTSGNAITLKGPCATAPGAGQFYNPSLASWEGYAYGTASAAYIVDSIGRQIPNPGYLAPATVGSCILDTDSSYYPTSGRNQAQDPEWPAITQNDSRCPAEPQGKAGTIVSETYLFPGQTSNGELSTTNTIPITFCYQQIAIRLSLPTAQRNTSTGQPESETFNETWPVLTAAILPNGTSWEFTYDSAEGLAWGQVTSVKSPTGAITTYGYGDGKSSNPAQNTGIRIACGNPPGEVPVSGSPQWPFTNLMSSRLITSRTITIPNPDGNALTELWTYSTTIGSGWEGSPNSGTVTVTDPLGNDTVHTFSLIGTPAYGEPVCGPYETATTNYQGSQSAGHPLKQVATQYTSVGIDNANPTNFSNYIAIGVVPQTVTTTLYTGGASPQVSQDVYTYDTFGTYQNYYGKAFPFSFEQLQSLTESDWGNGSAGSVLRKTLHKKQWQTSWNYYAANLVDLPYQDTVLCETSAASQTGCAGPGTQVSQTTYSYDESNYSYQGALGLQTSVARWLQSGAPPTTHNVYSSASFGMPVKKIDANGNTTAITYDASGLYPSAIQYPSTTENGTTIAHIEYPAHDDNTGLLLSNKDENGQITRYSYDSMRRLTDVSYPDGGSESYCFVDTSETTCSEDSFSYPSFTFTKAITSGLSYFAVGVADGLGRMVHTQVQTNDPSGWLSTDTIYDTLGRTASVSNPYMSTSDSSYGITLYSYDALSRKTIQTNPDGTKKQWCYADIASTGQPNCNALPSGATGASIDVSDENGNDWQQITDALGRQTRVREPNGSGTAPVMETDYTYDALNNLESVQQWGGSGGSPGGHGPVNRSFSYDGISRLLSSTNPESGTTTYSYDPNGNLLAKVSPAINASSGTQTMEYCYDALNRLAYKYLYAGSVSCTASSPSSATATKYAYDGTMLSGTAQPEGFSSGSPGTAGTGGTQPLSFTNSIGRLTEEQQYTGSTLVSQRVPIQYDSMGRLLIEQQTPYAPSGHIFQFTNQYDLAGDLTGSVNSGTNIDLSYQYDSAVRLKGITSNLTSYSSTTYPSSLYGVNSYGAPGVVQATYAGDANTTGFFNLYRHYDNRERVVDNEVYSQTDGFGTATVVLSGQENTCISGSGSSCVAETGTVSIVAGVTVTANFGANSTVQTIGSALVDGFNQNGNSPVSATLSSSGPANSPCQNGTMGSGGTLCAVITLKAIQLGQSGNVALKATDAAANSSSSSFVATASGVALTGGVGSATGSASAYVYSLSYQKNGNIFQSADPFNGSWIYTYDTLNRLSGSSFVSGEGTGVVTSSGTFSNQCWAYDPFGNRTNELESNSACPSTLTNGDSTHWTAYNNANRVTGSDAMPAGLVYDGAGDVMQDAVNLYLYDPEARLCALQNLLTHAMTQYIYDGEGRRMAKGTISKWPSATCAAPTTANGFALTSTYLRGIGGTEDAELIANNNWHQNVFDKDELMATYTGQFGSAPSLYFNFNDWLGTKRLEVNASGQISNYWASDPFGDYLTPHNANDATEQHFTGKERDTESGNDYFGARYYASSMGRFLSPDWAAKIEPVPYAKLDNPQSLNLYAYALNNPLKNTDPDGHETEAEKQAKIAAAAAAQKGSNAYDINKTNVSNMQIFKNGSDKCNEFVSDTVKSADGTRPVVDGTGKIPTAAQFADPNVKITGLSAPEPMSNAKPGDVIAQDHGAGANGNEEGHVGIVVGLPHDGQPGQTASANANQGGQVTVNDWGFRSPTANPNNGERNGASSPAPVVRHPLGDQQ